MFGKVSCTCSSGPVVEEDARHCPPSYQVCTRRLGWGLAKECKVANEYKYFFLSSGAPQNGVEKEAVKEENVSDCGQCPPVPPCHIGCTESLLGLLNIQQEKSVEYLLRVSC